MVKQLSQKCIPPSEAFSRLMWCHGIEAALRTRSIEDKQHHDLLMHKLCWEKPHLSVMSYLRTHQFFDYLLMNSMQTCKSVTFYIMKNSFSDVSRKWILPNMIRTVNQGQFTTKMKANAVSRLLSSLV